MASMVVGSMVGAGVFFSEDAFTFALDLTSALTLIPFLHAAAYALKVALGGRQAGGGTKRELMYWAEATFEGGDITRSRCVPRRKAWRSSTQRRRPRAGRRDHL